VAISEMVNQAVGDAMSGILMVESILRYKGWSAEDWDFIYEDVPSRQLKVVPNHCEIHIYSKGLERS
jgi:phosphoacetylglucosamine mutase